MALFQPTLSSKFASWFHPMWRLSGGVAVDADTTEVVAALDAGQTWGVYANHGWVAGVTYALGTRVETPVQPTTTYESLQDGNIGHSPESSPAWWQVVNEGLGADDEHWVTTPGLLRPNRNDSGSTWLPHLYARSAGASGIHWGDACDGGQWSMASGGSIPSPAVRMSGVDDTCYFATTTNDGYGDSAHLWKCISGVVSLVASGSGYMPAQGNNCLCVYAYEDRIGVSAGGSTSDLTTGWPMSGSNPAGYGIAQEIQVEVTDTSIPLASGPYVGVRAIAGTGSFHEWYGGSFGVLTAHAARPAGVLSGLRRPGTTITVT